METQAASRPEAPRIIEGEFIEPTRTEGHQLQGYDFVQPAEAQQPDSMTLNAREVGKRFTASDWTEQNMRGNYIITDAMRGVRFAKRALAGPLTTTLSYKLLQKLGIASLLKKENGTGIGSNL